ncbi:MAG TPA: transglutaminase family protein [Anaerolineae bacterium]|nr:transglutaminase family protein [Anaerolineae bacterium]
MHLKIEHTTTFSYDQPISEAYTEVRLRPLDGGGQRCLAFALNIEPRDEVLQYTDRYGNDVRHFDLLQSHAQLTVIAASEVLTPAAFLPNGAELEPLDVYDYLSATRYAPFAPALVEFAAAQGGSADALDSALALMHAIHGGLVYEKGATDVTTTAEQALALGRGVCQDFAHILLAACRCRNIPARYVSGYLYNNGRSAASHAWVDVYVAGRGWVSLDPTHDREPTDHYVRVAVGRDYADVPPTRGVFKGSAKEQLAVDVIIQAL